MIGGRQTWLGVAFWAAFASVTVLVVFTAIELVLYPGAATNALTVLHFVRGIAASLAGVGVAALFVRRIIADADQFIADRFAFLDRLPVAAFVLDAQGRPTYANDAALDLLGRGVIPVAGHNELSIVYPSLIAGTDEPYPPDQMPIVRALHGETSSIDNVELLRNGRRIPIEAIATPVYDTNGNISHSVAVFFDITERRRAEEERDKRLSEEHARRHERRVAALHAQFMNHAAHQLFTPLTPIRLEAQRLNKVFGANETERLERNVDRLGKLIQSVLDVAEVEALGHAPFDPATQVRDIIEDAVKAARAGHDAAVLVQAADGWLPCNRELLRRGIEAVVRNALEHSDGDSVWVSAEADEEIRISIHDNGRGWQGEPDMEWFQPFRQGSSQTDVEVGWGLGLFVAKVAAEVHGGRIEAHSPGPGQGATFTFHLPREPGEDHGR